MSSRLTMIAGTPTFVAPEQAQGEHLDARADQYSLGRADLPAVHRAGAVRPRRAGRGGRARRTAGPVGAGAGVPRARSSEVVCRALSPDREQRWPDVTTYVAALREALGEPHALRCRTPWLPPDPELTQPGARPTSLPGRGRLPDPTPPPPRRHRRLAGRVRGRRACAGAAVGTRSCGGDARLRDRYRRHRFAERHRALGLGAGRAPATGWRPADDRGRYPALSVGTAERLGVADSAGEGDLRRDPARHASSRPRCPSTPSAAGRRRRSPTRPTATVGDRLLHRLPGRRDRRARGPGGREPAALGAGAQRGPGDREHACWTASPRTASERGPVLTGTFSTLAPTRSNRSSQAGAGRPRGRRPTSRSAPRPRRGG